MGNLDPTRVLTTPGRLVIGPTNGGMLAGTYPYGSTVPVGFVRDCKLVRWQDTYPGNSEARGIDWANAYHGRNAAALVCVLEQYDPTILNLLYASVTTSPNGFAGANILSLPQPGRSLTPGLVAQGSQLLFAADDPTHPSILVYAPQYLISDVTKARVELARVLNIPLEQAFVVRCGLDSSSRDYAEALIENLST